ncbi:MAG: ABC-type transport auxiliary lipoprotein family protein [Propionivibrio sp.]
MKFVKSGLLSIIAAIHLAGCAVGGKTGPAVTVYDFGLPAAPLSADRAWSLLALEVDAPNWAKAPNVDYRLAYDEALELRQYAYSRWAGAPGDLLARHLRQQLGAVAASANVAWNCRLTVDLQEFSQVFDTPEQSRGVVQAMVHLVDAQRQLLAEKKMRVATPAPTPDAEGGVHALLAASTGMGQQIADWLATLPDDDRLRSCRTGA